MKLLDTNYVLRYILNDNPDMAQRAEETIRQGETCVQTEIFAEVVYVLSGVYKIPKDKIRDTLIALLDEVETPEPDVLREGLCNYADKGLDFVDCILLAYHTVTGAEVCTFDKKLNKFLDA